MSESQLSYMHLPSKACKDSDVVSNKKDLLLHWFMWHFFERWHLQKITVNVSFCWLLFQIYCMVEGLVLILQDEKNSIVFGLEIYIFHGNLTLEINLRNIALSYLNSNCYWMEHSHLLVIGCRTENHSVFLGFCSWTDHYN